ncbi:MAG: hypothetical protein RIC89_04890 [Pseudomonadales bacterium]
MYHFNHAGRFRPQRRGHQWAPLAAAAIILLGLAQSASTHPLNQDDLTKDFRRFLSVHYFQNDLSAGDGQLIVVTYGYALGQQLAYLRKDTAQHRAWLALDDWMDGRIRSIAARTGEDQSQLQTAYRAAVQGHLDPAVAAVVGEGKPRFFPPPAMEFTFSKEDLRSTELGKEVAELNERIRALESDAQRFDRDSDSYRALVAAAEHALKERDRIGEPLRGIRGRPVVIHGRNAQKDPVNTRSRTVYQLINRPDRRGSRYHVYTTDSGVTLVSLQEPGWDELYEW